MALILNVPYSEKDQAKALGAKWNPKLKKWYVERRKDYNKFIKWILDGEEETTIICDELYIVEGIHTCFKCKNKTKVIGFGIKKYFNIYNPDEYDDTIEFCDDDIRIVSQIDPLPTNLQKYLLEKYNYYKDFSKTTRSRYFANHCSNCKIIQGEFFLFGEVDSPFFIESPEDAKNLVLYKIPLKNDIILNANIGFGSTDWMIEKYARIEELDISI